MAGQSLHVGISEHQFSICIDRAQECGFEGVITRFAANAELVQRYRDVFEVVPLRALYSYHL